MKRHEERTAKLFWRCRLAHTRLPEILHLAHINPHVASALPLQSPGGQPLVCIARQPGGAPSRASAGESGWGACSGVSGFAFQGTNAHAILARRDARPHRG